MKAPIKNFISKLYPEGSITQWFGENKALYSKAVCVPDGSGAFGDNYCLQGHNGIDIVASWGTELFAVEGGKVIEVRKDETGFGRHIRIASPTDEPNVYREWVYGHMQDIIVERGRVINEGDPIGTMGNTGFVVSGHTPYWKHNPFAGTHLHLGVRDRIIYEDGSQGGIKNYYNGFYGFYDFKHLLVEGEEKEDKDLTIESLTNLAEDYERKGDKKSATIVRAVIALVRAFK